jgi:hypothetical protein
MQITQHIRCGLAPLPFGTLLPLVATSYMLETLSEIARCEGSELKMLGIEELKDRIEITKSTVDCPVKGLQ